MNIDHVGDPELTGTNAAIDREMNEIAETSQAVQAVTECPGCHATVMAGEDGRCANCGHPL
jgi:uncharacterized paraquat-inducible protein A